MWQAEHVRDALLAAHPGLTVELKPVTTEGDRLLDSTLHAHGGKGLFLKELEQALLADEADIAVHSMKDVTVELPPGLEIAAILEREDPRDALVGRSGSITDLSPGAKVGTASLRRQVQLLSLRPDLKIETVRGNVGTRLRKLDEEGFEVIVLAAAGLKRLGLGDRVAGWVAPEHLLPAVGQAAVGIECRDDDDAVKRLLQPLRHALTEDLVRAERAFNRRLGGGCHAPIAAFAEIQANGSVRLRALVGSLDGSELVRGEAQGERDSAESLGIGVAEDLLSRGADRLLAAAQASQGK